MPPHLRAGRLFCSEICRQRADTVRYGRRIYRDGRIKDALVADAFRTKMAFAVTEIGYAEAGRELDSETRRSVIERDGGKCVMCGKPGTEIDHVVDSSLELMNLQLLCHDCHARKTRQNFRPIEPGSRAEVIWTQLMDRIQSPVPLRPCDDEVAWPSSWKKITAERRSAAQLGAAGSNSKT
jgi:hypothetical protein